MEKLHPWWGQPSDRGPLKNRTEQYQDKGTGGLSFRVIERNCCISAVCTSMASNSVKNNM